MKAVKSLIKELQDNADQKMSEREARYFKTGKGGYGEGDIFLGLTVPQMRIIAKKYQDLPLSDIKALLRHKIHEHRWVALRVLCLQFQKGSPKDQKIIYTLYLGNTSYINNWDLIDGSAPTIIGGYLLGRPADRKILYKLARSKSL